MSVSSDRLVSCYEDCAKFYGDDLPGLRSCYAICDAMWGSGGESNFGTGFNLNAFSRCFPQGILELEEFKAEFRRVGRFGFSDWQIVNRISMIVDTMLKEGRANKCPNLEEAIVKVIAITLIELGISNCSIGKADLRLMNNDVKRIILRIFPNVTEIKRVREDKVARLKAVSELASTSEQSYRYYPQLPSKHQPGKGHSPRSIGAIVLIILSLLALGYSFAIHVTSLMILAFVFAIIALAIRPKWYTGLWFFIVLISILIMLSTTTP